MATVRVFSGYPVRLRWGAVFGGALAAIGFWLLLYAFGLAAGLSALDPRDPGSARGAGIGAGIWALIAPLIAWFFGGVVVSRAAGLIDRPSGVVHGIVMWSLTTIVGAAIGTMAISSLVGGTVRLGGAVAQATGSAVAGIAGGATDIAARAGLSGEQLVEPINRRLIAQGKPTVTADQLDEALRAVVTRSIAQGRLDQRMFVDAIAERTALSRAEAQDLAMQIRGEWDRRAAQARAQVQEAGETLGAGAIRAAETTGKVLWGVFGSLLLGLISAILGATIGVVKRRRLTTAVVTPTVAGPPPGEVPTPAG